VSTIHNIEGYIQTPNPSTIYLPLVAILPPP